MSRPDRPVLSDSQLAGFRERAYQLDRDNEFFAEDFEELRRAGYLRVNVPEEFGGLGRSLPEVALEQRRLAERAAPIRTELLRLARSFRG